MAHQETRIARITLFFMIASSLTFSHAFPLHFHDRGLASASPALGKAPFLFDNSQKSTAANAGLSSFENANVAINSASEGSKSSDTSNANTFMINKRQLKRGLAFLNNMGETHVDSDKANSQNAEIQSNKAKEQNFNVDSSSSGTSMFGKRTLKTPFLFSSNNAENHEQEQAASVDNLAANLNKANSENYNLQDDQASTKMVNKRGIYLE